MTEVVRMMTDAEFHGLLRDLQTRRSELDDVEVKAANRGTPERMYETISAFANRTGGGMMVFGLEDKTFQPIGVFNPDQLQRDLAAEASEMEPPVRLEFQSFVMEPHVIVVVQVPETDPQYKPCYYKPRGLTGGAYVRVGDGDRHMTEYEVYTYLASRGPIDDDRSVVAQATMADLDADLITQYLALLRIQRTDARYLRGSTEEVLRTLGITAATDHGDAPTLAGLLTFGIYPQRLFPSLVITLTVQGTDAGTERFAANFKAEGPILDMLKQAMAWMQRNIRTRTLITGLIHQEIAEYPLDALREALVNAVVHRDYSRYALGTQVQVRLFPDRIEIQNPGGLFGPVSVDRLGEPGLQNTRNTLLARLLEDLGPMENRGSGIRTILQALRQAHLAPPRFEDTRTSFRVTFFNHTLLTHEALDWLQRFAGVPELSDRQRYALVFLRQQGRLANRDYQMLNAVDARTATRELRGMVDAGLVEPVGSRGGAYYQLAPSRAVQARLPMQAASQGIPASCQGVYDLVREGGPIGPAEIAQRLGLGRQQVNYRVSRLLAMGLIRATEPHPRSRNQKYIAAD